MWPMTDDEKAVIDAARRWYAAARSADHVSEVMALVDLGTEVVTYEACRQLKPLKPKPRGKR
jgi:hypothetical protein